MILAAALTITGYAVFLWLAKRIIVDTWRDPLEDGE